MHPTTSLLLLFLCAAFAAYAANQAKLVLDFVRHGHHSARQNLTFFPEITWIYADELSAIGERVHFLLGRYRRQLYIENYPLLPPKYDPATMFVRSTDYRRTIMSAQSYLQGLYSDGAEPLNEKQLTHSEDLLIPQIKLSDEIKGLVKGLKATAIPPGYTPIPIFISAAKTETMLRVTNCKYWDYMMDQYIKGEKYKKLRTEKYGAAFEAIKANYKGITEEYLSNSANALDLADFLICAEDEGRRPSKLTAENMAMIKDFWAEVLFDECGADDTMVKIGFAEIGKEILDQMNQTITSKGKRNTKYGLYLGHSKTISYVILGLNKLNNSIVLTKDPFVTNVLFELSVEPGKEDDQYSYYVNVNYLGKIVYTERYAKFRDDLQAAIDTKGKTREEICKVKDKAGKYFVKKKKAGGELKTGIFAN